VTARERMTRGDPYDPRDPGLVAARKAARALLGSYNATAASVDLEERARILARLLGRAGEGAWIEPPFQCDYGFNIALGRGVYMNFGCVILDVAPVSIGDNALFGPAVQLYTAGHPLDAEERRAGLEWGKPIAIGDDVWIGGNVVVVPGVTIGARTVVAAGSVVTRDLPAGVVAAGNPCRVIRPLDAPRTTA
jgi:maltose O-acetyltransferase